MEDILNKKLIEEKKIQQEIKESLDKKKKNTKKISKGSLHKKPECHLPKNVKELPDLVKAKYPHSKDFCVIGDRASCLNCLAAWIMLDPKLGPTLGRDLNTHIAEYRPYYKNKLAFPLTITKAGGVREVFEEGEEDKFFDTLVSSSEASYMWRESHDMIALSNFTNMEVEVIVYDQETKVIEEPVQQYKPDHEFPWKEEDANAPNENNYQKMKLLNYKNCHFNLIVKEDHPLITSSSDTNNLESTTQNTTSVKVVKTKRKTEINVTKDVLCKKCETTFKKQQ